MLFAAWVVFHVIVCAGLIIVVLLQSSKGEGLAGSAFGGGGGLSGAVFGGRGAASFLSKATTVLAIVFMINCGALALMTTSESQTVSPANPGEQPTSNITEKAQLERDQALQQQQQLADTNAISIEDLNILSDTTTPADTSGN